MGGKVVAVIQPMGWADAGDDRAERFLCAPPAT